MVMEEEVKYTSEFDGQTTDEVLKHAKSVKDLTIPSLSNISGFVCIDNEGKAIGMMSKGQVAQVVGGLLNNIYSAFTLQKGVKTEIASRTGIYYVSQPYLDSVSCLIIIDYDNAYVYGNKRDINFEVTTSKLFATYNGSESSFDIRIRT